MSELFRKLKRDPAKVEATLMVKDNKVFTKTGCKIYVPSTFKTKRFLKIGTSTEILGVYAIVVDDKYFATDAAITMLKIKPSSITVEKDGDDEYHVFWFDKGDIVIDSTAVLVDKLLLYHVDDLFIAKGKVPKYLGYEGLLKLFHETPKWNGMKLGSTLAVPGLIAATITRDAKDLKKPYRESINSKADLDKVELTYAGLRNIGVTASNALAKTLGSYAERGMVSAINNQSTRTEEIEELLRS